MSNFKLAAAALFICALAPRLASAWWNDDWAYRKQIDFDASQTGAGLSATLKDVPVLIRLHAGNFSYFGDVQPNGADLRFVAADDKTPLKFHIERFDPVNQLALIWVKVPQLTGGAKSDSLYLYYGNPKATAGGDPGGTYDKNQVLDLHFSEETGPPRDSTAYHNNPEQSRATPAAAALIAGGVELDGTQGIEIPSSPSLRVLPSQGVTVSAWVKIAQPQQDAYLVSMLDAVGSGLVLGISGQGPFARLGASDGARVAATTALSLGEWHHLAVAAGEGRLRLYVDGQPAGDVQADLPEIGAPTLVGQSGSGMHGLVGALDELEIANTVRSPDWIKAANASQGMLSSLVIYGADAQKEASGGQSYFVITLRNVTPDGWVVIFLLGVMFAISAAVMIGKTLLLGRVERENRRFLTEYRKLGTGDPLALAKLDERQTEEPEEESTLFAALASHAAFRPSTLFPLYLAGVNEVRHRLQSPSVGVQRRGFTAETIGAIRSTVDARLVRERQKLNKQMVLLTIAISGGPFLGLLGTVVGVMITFAAIAASGDVNVNAIAPGIAAALAATVAGLAVAIPALFGYNWLSTRIRDIDAETHVFADEFVNKLAEHYV